MKTKKNDGDIRKYCVKEIENDYVICEPPKTEEKILPVVTENANAVHLYNGDPGESFDRAGEGLPDARTGLIAITVMCEADRQMEKCDWPKD